MVKVNKAVPLDLAIKTYTNVVVFGGAGFIGRHLCDYLLHHQLAERIFIADIASIEMKRAPNSMRDGLAIGTVQVLQCDVREKIANALLPNSVDLIVNLAGVHREPGHHAREYYETNLLGAENVCIWAELVGCGQIVFASSISVYGDTSGGKNEVSLPAPISPYGNSKLIAEKIHVAWQKGSFGRKLVIVRPGVIFGHGEQGNVSRLVKAVIHGYFAYFSNKSVIKAGGYVKELSRSIVWALNQEHENGILLYNFTFYPPPRLENYVTAIRHAAQKKKFIPDLPFTPIYLLTFLVDWMANILSITQPVSPVRVKKLHWQTDVTAAVLKERGYQYQFNLEEAMCDWNFDCDEEWR